MSRALGTVLDLEESAEPHLVQEQVPLVGEHGADGTELDSALVNDSTIDLALGVRVFEAAPVRGVWRRLSSPDDVLALMDTSAEGVVACVADAGATFLAPIFDELTAVVCLSGTPLSHIGIVSREYQVPCVMSAVFASTSEPTDGDAIEVDCSASRRHRAAGLVTAPLGAGWDRDRCNEWFRYHSEISYALTMQRTALESALIPVTAYIVVACVECYRRYPAMVQQIADAVPPEELGRAGHELATQIDPVRLWAVPNFTLLGRTVLAGAGLLDADRKSASIAPVLDFWERAARAYRFDDGTHQAWDADGVATPYRAHVDDIVDGMPAGARRRRACADGAPQRAASRRICSCCGSTRAPATRTPVRTASPTGGRCCSGRSTGSASRTSRGAARCRPSCRTPTSSPRSCSTTCRPACHRLRHVGDGPAGLPAARRRVRSSSTSPTGR